MHLATFESFIINEMKNYGFFYFNFVIKLHSRPISNENMLIIWMLLFVLKAQKAFLYTS